METLESPSLEPRVMGPDREHQGVESPPGTSPAKAKAETNQFEVGDLVWGKIKSHPWWPGQVYDPLQASDHARNANRKEHSLLVAYFGDDSFAWCEPARLRSFAEGEFRDTVRQNGSKSFRAAVGDALDVIGGRLRSDLTCHCILEEARDVLEPQTAANAECGVINYTPVEFLDRLRGVAQDVATADLLEATMMCSWSVMFGKGSFSSGSFVYRPRREIGDLVDKIDLDALPLDSVGDEIGQEVPSLIGYQSRKKRSMAKLIAEMDLDAVEVSDDEEEKKAETGTPSKAPSSKHEEEKKAETGTSNKAPSSKRKKGKKVLESVDVQLWSADAEEETGLSLGRRERKKSKYLSPPYMFPSGYAKLSASFKDTDSKTPKKATEVSSFLLPNSPTITKCTHSLLQGEEEDMRSPAFKIDSVAAADILSEFQLTALNPLHLKWNRLAKTVRGFLAVYRSSMYSNGSEFDAYQKHLVDCGVIDGNSTSKDTAVSLKDGRADGRKKRRKDGANEEIPLDLGLDTTNDSEPKNAGQKRKMRKGGANEETPLYSGLDTNNHSEPKNAGQKRKSRKGGTNEKTPLDLGLDTTNHSEQKKAERKRKMRKEGAYRASPLDIDQDPTNLYEQGKSEPNRKTRKGGSAEEALLGSVLDATDCSEQGKAALGGKIRKDAADLEHPLDLNIQIADGVEGGKTIQKRKKNKDGAVAKTMGSVHEPIGSTEVGKIRKKTMEGKEESNLETPTELMPMLADCRDDNRSGHNKSKDGPAGESLVDLGGEVSNGKEAGKTRQVRKKKEVNAFKGPATLLLTFAPGVTLPSKEHLISTFSKYGDLIESETELLKESGCARVVFAKSTDAEKALDSTDKSEAFGSPAPSYRLCHLPGNFSSPLQQMTIAKPPLPYIRRSLERMISTLTGSSSPEKDAGSSDGLKPEARENLVGEMRGLLTKVNKMLTSPPAGVFS